MNDKIIVISPIYHNDVTHVTDVRIWDNSEPFTDATPVQETGNTNLYNHFRILCDICITKLVCSCAILICCFFFFFVIGGFELFF